MTPERLIEVFDDTDAKTFALLDELTDEQLAVPYERGINPPIWELGHSAFFYEYFLLRPLLGIEPVMPGFDPVWDSFDIPHRERWADGVVPGKSETFAYYRRVFEKARDLVSPENDPDDETRYLGQYCVAHQCMHLESLVWSRQTLGLPAPSYSKPHGFDPTSRTKPEDATIGGGEYFIGVSQHGVGKKSENFSFDNERPGFTRRIAEFRISPTLVTQGEFLEFVEDGGYSNQDNWSFGGRYWLRQNGRENPAYWEKREGEWFARVFDKTELLSPGAPMIHVSFWEAEAFCKWAGRRLPTEFEWEAAARGTESLKYPWGDAEPTCEEADLDCSRIGTSPVTDYPDAKSPSGCLQMIGTAWEWTTSQYLPFDGFCVDMYPYMSTLQFGDHKTTRGGSFATASSLIRSTYRQAYHPDRHDVFAGFRTCAVG